MPHKFRLGKSVRYSGAPFGDRPAISSLRLWVTCQKRLIGSRQRMNPMSGSRENTN